LLRNVRLLDLRPWAVDLSRSWNNQLVVGRKTNLPCAAVVDEQALWPEEKLR